MVMTQAPTRMIKSHFQDLRRRKAFQEGRNLPLRTIADETKLSLTTVQRISSGDMKGIRLTTLDTLCDYFGVESLSDLVEYVRE